MGKLFAEQALFDKYLNAYRLQKGGREMMEILKKSQQRPQIGSRASMRGGNNNNNNISDVVS